MKLNERTSALNTLLQEKLNRMQQVENARQQLANEIIEIQGQLKLLKELIIESKDSSEKQDGDIKPTRT